jgi:hypothetical protein
MDQFKKGGKLQNSNLFATNRLFAKNPLFKKRKKKAPGIYNPKAKYKYPDGGLVQVRGYEGAKFKKNASGNWIYESGAPVTDPLLIQKLTYEAIPVGAPVVQSAPKVSLQPRITSQERIQKINDLSKSPRIADQEQAFILAEEQRNVDIYNPEVTPEEKIKPKGLKDLRNLEWNINEKLGFPFERAHTAAAAATEDAGEEVDNFRHPLAARYVAEGIADATGNIPYISPALGFIGSNLLGAGHEFMTLVNPGEDDRSLLTRLSEAGEDVYNNYIGAKVGASDMTPIEKTNYLLYLSSNNKLPDGVVIEKDPKAKGSNNLYFKKGPNDPGKYKSSYAAGGELETEITPTTEVVPTTEVAPEIPMIPDPTVTPQTPVPTSSNAISSAPTFNEAFKIARSTYGPNNIFEYQGRKYGTNLAGEDFKPSEEVLSKAGLNTPSVKANLNKQNTDLNDPYVSKSTVKLEADSYKGWDEIKQKNLELNTSANADKIINYKNSIKGDKNYIIVDKKKGLMHVYEPGNSKPLFTSAVDLGASKVMPKL